MNSHPTDLSRGNILLVDDTPNNLRLLSAMLIDQGYNVRRVISGSMALKTAEANPPDLILLDIRMPDMNGYEVCQYLKTTTGTHDIPVIFISALDEVLDKVKAFAVGGIDYITKPFSEEEVFVRVENVLTIRKLQKQLQKQNERLKQEIMERKQLEEKSLSSDAKYRYLFNHSTLGIFRTRIDDSLLLDANQRLAGLLGYSAASEIIQQTVLTDHYVNPIDRDHILTALQANHEIYHYRMQFYKQDGSTFWGLLFLRLSLEAECIDGVIIESL